MHGTNAAHGGALLKLHTGSDRFVRPSMGSWVLYGLGTENENLPGFITICPTLAHGGVKNWSSAFLPATFQGTPLGVASQPATEARLKYVANAFTPQALQRLQLDLLQEMNEAHLQQVAFEQDLEARMRTFELAFRMQTEMPDVEDLSQESPATRRLYGLDDPVTADFGRQCLLARPVRRAWRAFHPSHPQRHQGAMGPARGFAQQDIQKMPTKWTAPLRVCCAI